jgi:hypothetical protein
VVGNSFEELPEGYNLVVVDGTSVGVSEGSVVGNSDWGSVVGNGDWTTETGNWEGSTDCNWGSDGDLGDSGGRSVNNGVESLDGVSGVGDGPDGTIGLDEGVLSLDNISVTGLRCGLGVSGQGIGDGVSVVVLWVRVIWLGLDGDGLSDGDRGMSDGEWGVVGHCVRGSGIGSGSNDSSAGNSSEGKDSDSLEHLDFFDVEVGL